MAFGLEASTQAQTEPEQVTEPHGPQAAKPQDQQAAEPQCQHDDVELAEPDATRLTYRQRKRRRTNAHKEPV